MSGQGTSIPRRLGRCRRHAKPPRAPPCRSRARRHVAPRSRRSIFLFKAAPFFARPVVSPVAAQYLRHGLDLVRRRMRPDREGNGVVRTGAPPSNARRSTGLFIINPTGRGYRDMPRLRENMFELDKIVRFRNAVHGQRKRVHGHDTVPRVGVAGGRTCPARRVPRKPFCGLSAT